jgi:homoserine dehydrogenase
MMPTAMAVVSDLIEVCRNIQAGATGALPLRSYQRMVPRRVRDMADLRCRYYLRFGVLDQPGVLGQITTILGEHSISIAQVVQEGPSDPDRPERYSVVMLSHEAREGDVTEALAKIAELEVVVEPTAVIRIALTAA